MTLTTHAVVGAAVASLFPQEPALALCAAFASHFLVDAIPHHDYSIRSASVDPKIGAPMKFDRALLRDAVVIGGDALLGIALALFFFATPQNFVLIFFAACAAILPDPLQFVYAHFPREPLATLYRFHQWIHTPHRLKDAPVLGVISQVAFLVVVVVSVKFIS